MAAVVAGPAEPGNEHAHLPRRLRMVGPAFGLSPFDVGECNASRDQPAWHTIFVWIEDGSAREVVLGEDDVLNELRVTPITFRSDPEVGQAEE